MFRISNGVRTIENVVGFVAVSVGRKAARTAHDVHIEYKARQLAAESKRITKQMQKVNDMSWAEKRQMERDQRDIVARTNELLAGRR